MNCEVCEDMKKSTKQVCIILPRIDLKLNRIFGPKKRTRFQDFNGESSNSNPVEQARRKTCKRIRIKTEQTCPFHSEVDLNHEENYLGNFPRDPTVPVISHLHELNQSSCYMCGLSPGENKAQIREEINRLERRTEERILTPRMIDAAVSTESVPISTTSQSVQTDLLKVDQNVQTNHMYPCKYCQSYFSKLEYLEHHKIMHARLHECIFCQGHFISKDDLKSHIKLHNLPKFYECIYCHQIFKKKGDFKTHLSSHIEKHVFRCNSCPAVFFQKSSLIEHEKKKLNPTNRFIHVFKKVDDQNINRQNLETVMSKNSNLSSKEFYICEYCPINCKNLSAYKKHVKCHTRKIGKHKCMKCLALFLRKGGLQRHLHFAHSLSSRE